MQWTYLLGFSPGSSIEPLSVKSENEHIYTFKKPISLSHSITNVKKNTYI